MRQKESLTSFSASESFDQPRTTSVISSQSADAKKVVYERGSMRHELVGQWQQAEHPKQHVRRTSALVVLRNVSVECVAAGNKKEMVSICSTCFKKHGQLDVTKHLDVHELGRCGRGFVVLVHLLFVFFSLFGRKVLVPLQNGQLDVEVRRCVRLWANDAKPCAYSRTLRSDSEMVRHCDPTRLLLSVTGIAR